MLLVLALAIAYVHLRENRLAAGLLFGVRAATLAAIAQTVVRSFWAESRERRQGAIAAGAFVAMVACALPVPLVLAGSIAAGLAADALRPGATNATTASPAGARPTAAVPTAANPTAARPAAAAMDSPTARAVVGTRVVARVARQLALGLALWIVPLVALAVALGPAHVVAREAFFFGKTALVAAGALPAVLAYAAQPLGAPPVWASAGEMLDGLGMGLVMSGHSLQMVPFFGFLAAWRSPGSWPGVTAGLAGAVTAGWAACLPAAWVLFVLGPRLRSLRGGRRVEAAIQGFRCGWTGVVAGLWTWLAVHLLFAGVRVWEGPLGWRGVAPRWWSLDLSAIALTAVAYLAVARWNWSPRVTVLASAGVGLLLRWGLGVL